MDAIMEAMEAICMRHFFLSLSLKDHLGFALSYVGVILYSSHSIYFDPQQEILDGIITSNRVTKIGCFCFCF